MPAPGFLLVASAIASAVAASAASTNPSTDDMVELSPFVITAAADTGYAATETLSGTRLRANVRDVASAFTIVTAEFMRDIGAVNFNDVLDFMPGTASYASNGTDQFSNGPRTGTPFIVRGYRSDSLQTNFFTSFTGVDAYNTSRLTFTRGPNSILFGIGNPGGSLGVETNRADLAKNINRLEVRADTFDSFRVALDSSLVLVPGRAAIRVDLLHDDRRQNIKPSKNRRDSIFLTSTVRPTAATVVTASVEGNQIRQQIVANVTSNLRLMVNASHNTSALQDHGAATFAYLAENYILDPTRPITGRGSKNLDAWLDYERQVSFRARKFRWSAQVRVQNVFDDRTVLPWTADDDGTGHAYIQSRRTPGARMLAVSSSVAF